MRANLSVLSNSEPRYSVHGEILFYVDGPKPADQELVSRFRELILLEESNHEIYWVDENGFDLKRELSRGEVDRRLVSFNLTPSRKVLRNGQLRAYEKYLADFGLRLIESATERKLPILDFKMKLVTSSYISYMG